jgi:hypothetical protein
MVCRTLKLLVITSLLLMCNIAPVFAQVADGTVKITARTASEGVGLSWGEGVLTYKGRDYPFTFNANGLFRNVDPNIAAKELSGEVFNLKSLGIFSGVYSLVQEDVSKDDSGSRATMKNLDGVVIHVSSSAKGRKFNLSRDGMKIELKQQKP